MFKILVFLFISFNLHAEITELADGLTVDTKKFTAKLAECGGVETPGTICLYQCYDINNTAASNYYTCDLNATGSFNEMIPWTNPPLYTGNILTAVDYRTITIYPYQSVTVCFNFGKEVVENTLWAFSTSSIVPRKLPDGSTGECLGGTVGAPPTPVTLAD